MLESIANYFRSFELKIFYCATLLSTLLHLSYEKTLLNFVDFCFSIGAVTA